MATKRKTKNTAETEQPIVETEQKEEIITEVEEKEEVVAEETENKPEEAKYAIGSIVFISKEAEADLNGFKLFTPYKKYTYTVEAYDADTKVYTLRRLNLSLRLPEALILAPSEKSDNPLVRRQF